MKKGMLLGLISVLLTACPGKPGSGISGGSSGSSAQVTISTGSSSGSSSGSSAGSEGASSITVSPGSSTSSRYKKIDLVLVVDDTDEADVYRARMKDALTALGNTLFKDPNTNTCLAIVLASRTWSRSGKELVVGCSKPSNAESLSASQLNIQADAMVAAARNFIPVAGQTIKAPLGKALVSFLYNSADWEASKNSSGTNLQGFFRADAITHFHFFSHMNNWRQINPATMISGQENTGAWHIQERRMDLPMTRNSIYTFIGNSSLASSLGWSAAWPTVDSRKGYKDYLDESLARLKGGNSRYSVSIMGTEYDENDYGLFGCAQGISNRAQNMVNLVSAVRNGSVQGNIQQLSGVAYDLFYQNLGQGLASASF